MPNTELRHNRRGPRHDEANEQEIAHDRRKRKGRRLLPQVIR